MPENTTGKGGQDAVPRRMWGDELAGIEVGRERKHQPEVWRGDGLDYL
jgi:hypothetical protein